MGDVWRRAHERIIITERGRPVAALAPYRKPAKANRFRGRKLLPAYKRLSGNPLAGVIAEPLYRRTGIGAAANDLLRLCLRRKVLPRRTRFVPVRALAEDAGEVACAFTGRLKSSLFFTANSASALFHR